MRCPRCQFENPSETRFCGNCAAPLAAGPAGGGQGFGPTETLRTPVHELATGAVVAKDAEAIEEKEPAEEDRDEDEERAGW
jgi:hypothetical protein